MSLAFQQRCTALPDRVVACLSAGSARSETGGGVASARVRWWIRLLVCQLLPMWCGLLLSASAAWAAPGSSAPEQAAPMCDPSGASVVARDEVPEVDTGGFEALPCEAQLMLSGWRWDPQEFGGLALSGAERDPAPQPGPAPRVRHEGAVASGLTPFPMRTEPSLVWFFERRGIAPSRGHDRLPFRPPVAAA